MLKRTSFSIRKVNQVKMMANELATLRAEVYVEKEENQELKKEIKDLKKKLAGRIENCDSRVRALNIQVDDKQKEVEMANM